MTVNPQKSSMNRREFVGRVSGAAGAGLLLARQGTAAPAQLEKRNEQSGMIYAPFGRTNLNVSRLTFGCIQLTDDKLPALEMAVERGVNLVHVSRSYVNGQAIVSLGKFFKKPGNRDKVWLMLKGVPQNIDDQLKTLNTDHVDIICAPLNAPDQIRKGTRENAAFEALQKAGKARFLNLTTHASVQDSMEAALDQGDYSSLLAALDPTTVGAMKPTLQRAAKMNVGVMAMKSQRNSKSATPDQLAAALLGAGVTTILKTLNTARDVEAWIAAVNKASRTASALLDAPSVASAAGVCTLCGLCEGCPNGVAVQSIVRDYTYYYEQQGLAAVASERYAELGAGETAAACGDCGRCEKVCPMGVPVRRILREAHARLGAPA